MNKPFAGVFELVCPQSDQDLTGEFHPDQDAVAAWQAGPDQEYHGEFRYGNKSPTELRRMIDNETDPVEKVQMQKIMDRFIAMGLANDPNIMQGGEPYRGEDISVTHAENMKALAESVNIGPEMIKGTNAGMGQKLSDLHQKGETLGMVKGIGGIWEEK